MLGVVVPLIGVVLAFLLPKVFKDDRDTGIPLCSWYSPSRNDNLTTTDYAQDEQSCSPDGGPAEGGYGFVRKEGIIFDARGHRPSGTALLCGWYSLSRREYITTSDPRWVGSDCRSSPPELGYQFVQLEGYIYDHPTPGSHPLCSWYSPERRDNFATTDPRWTGRDCAVAKVPEEGYTFVRTEGYVEDYLKQSG